MANTPEIDARFEQVLRAFLRRGQQGSEACPDPAMISAYYERGLGEDEAGELEAHLAVCVDCQAELAMLARLDTGTSAVAPEPPAVEPRAVEPPAAEPRATEPRAVELRAEQLEPSEPEPSEPEPPEEIEEQPEEKSEEPEEPKEIEDDRRPFGALSGSFPSAPRRRWRWVTPAALAATAVIAVSVTYRFAVDDAARRGLELRGGAPRREPPPSPPRGAPRTSAPHEEDESPWQSGVPPEAGVAKAPAAAAPPAAALGGAAVATPAASAPAAAAPEPPQPKEAENAVLAKKKEDASAAKGMAAAETGAVRAQREREAKTAGDELARSEKPVLLQAPSEKQKLSDQDAGAAGALGTQAMVRAAPRSAFVVSSRTNDRTSWRFTGSKIERTEDGGRSWQTLGFAAPTSILAASAPTDDVCWAIGLGGIVIRTTDGKSWQAVSSPTNVDLVYVSAWNDSSATVKSSDGSRFSTTDGGASWSRR